MQEHIEPPTEDDALSKAEAARMLGANPRTLDNWRSLGKGPAYYKLSHRHIIYSRKDIIDYRNRHRVEPRG